MNECSNFKYLSPEELTYSAATFATAISKDLDNDSVGVLGSFFTAMGNMLTLISKQRALIKNCCPSQSKAK